MIPTVARHAGLSGCLCILSMLPLIGGGSASAGEGPRILFDEGHGQRFLVDRQGPLDLSRFGEVLEEAGFEVLRTTETLAEGRLGSVEALVISGPFEPLAREEIDAVVDWLDGGGVLMTMLHVPGPLTEVLRELEVVHSNGVVRERENVLEGEARNFRVTRLRDHALTTGLEAFSIFGSWALLNENSRAEVIAETGPGSWVDLDGDSRLGPGDAVQRFAVAIAGTRGLGRFAVFGDDALFQNRFLVRSNLELARNLAAWIGQSRPRIAEIRRSKEPFRARRMTRR